MKFSDLYNELSISFPKSLSCDWDNDGIMCAHDLTQECKKVLIALDVTMDVVNYAIDNGFDTIISHHPLVFRAQKSLSPTSFTQSKLIKLIKNNINVMSFHTRLDAALGGVNDVLCRALGLINAEPDPSDSIGRIAYTVSPCELSSFAENVKHRLNSQFVLFNGKNTVHKVYVVGGDGKDLIDNAISSGCDTIITGRGSYNTTIDAQDMGINIVEAGHFFTENPVCNAIFNKILEIDSSIAAEIYFSNQIKCI